MGLLWGLQYNLWYGVGGGLAAGILFGVLMAAFTNKMKKRIKRVEDSSNKRIGDGEIIFSSCANTVDGFFPKLGWLSLTRTHLFFTQESKNSSKEYIVEIALNSIQEVKICKHRLNPNAILVTYDGKEQKFLMDGFGENQAVRNTIWVDAIQNAVSLLRKDAS